MALPTSTLVEKYGLSAPMYISYPRALQFVEGFDETPLLNDLATEEAPIAVYIHLPFCWSMCWF